MKYMGSKGRMSKHILPIILRDRTEGQFYVEPFCGGCNMIDKVKGNRIANDKNPYLIQMWRHLTKGWNPPRVIEKDFYHAVRDSWKQKQEAFPPELIGWVGFTGSYRGLFFGSYSGHARSDKTGVRDYIGTAARSILRQVDDLRGVCFLNRDYKDLVLLSKCIIYCDPPYRGTEGYQDAIDHKDFWDWCRRKVKQGHRVFVSEYSAPDDFRCIWEMEVRSSVDYRQVKKCAVEKLFVHESQI